MDVIFHISNGDTIHERYDGDVTFSEIEEMFKTKYLHEATKIRFLYQGKILTGEMKLSDIGYIHPREIMTYPTPMLKPKPKQEQPSNTTNSTQSPQNLKQPGNAEQSSISQSQNQTNKNKYEPKKENSPAISEKTTTKTTALPTEKKSTETKQNSTQNSQTPSKSTSNPSSSQSFQPSQPKPAESKPKQAENKNSIPKPKQPQPLPAGAKPPSQQDLNKARNPGVEKVRKIVLEKPNSSLYAVINSIGKSDPVLADKVRANPIPFLTLLGIPYKIENGKIVLQEK